MAMIEVSPLAQIGPGVLGQPGRKRLINTLHILSVSDNEMGTQVRMVIGDAYYVAEPYEEIKALLAKV